MQNQRQAILVLQLQELLQTWYAEPLDVFLAFWVNPALPVSHSNQELKTLEGHFLVLRSSFSLVFFAFQVVD